MCDQFLDDWDVQMKCPWMHPFGMLWTSKCFGLTFVSGFERTACIRINVTFVFVLGMGWYTILLPISIIYSHDNCIPGYCNYWEKITICGDRGVDLLICIQQHQPSTPNSSSPAIKHNQPTFPPAAKSSGIVRTNTGKKNMTALLNWLATTYHYNFTTLVTFIS